jgi:hypothetical protein
MVSGELSFPVRAPVLYRLSIVAPAIPPSKTRFHPMPWPEHPLLRVQSVAGGPVPHAGKKPLTPAWRRAFLRVSGFRSAS